MFSGAEVARGWKTFFEIYLKLILEGKESAPPYKFCAGEKGLLVFNPEQGNFTTRVSIFHAA